MHEIFIWLAILFCISQSALFSGLNLAFFSISRLRLEVESTNGSKTAAKILAMRNDGNFLLTTILWGNVGINVLLTLLSNSVLTGLVAFLFSTLFITIAGEILPQAYFSRNARKMASALSPVLRFYQVLLYPVAKPSALLLDVWLGGESTLFFKERDLEEMFNLHIQSDESDIGAMEGQGALNFLALDDLSVHEEGEHLDPKSIVKIPFEGNHPVFPEIKRNAKDAFLKSIQLSGKKWIILTDEKGAARLVLDADAFLRDAIFGRGIFNPLHHCHRPVMVTDPNSPLEDVITRFKVYPVREGDDVVDADIILLWGGGQKKIITGADILGRLLRGIIA
jgi:hypothetical protein